MIITPDVSSVVPAVLLVLLVLLICLAWGGLGILWAAVTIQEHRDEEKED